MTNCSWQKSSVQDYHRNTRWAPHLEISPEGFTAVTTQRCSLFPSRPAVLVQLWVRDLAQRLLNIQCCLVVTWLVPHENAAVSAHVLCTIHKAVWLLHGWCHMKMLPSRRTFCVQYTRLFGCYMAGATWKCCRFGARSVYNTQPCTSLRHFLQSHISRVHVCLAVT